MFSLESACLRDNRYWIDSHAKSIENCHVLLLKNITAALLFPPSFFFFFVQNLESDKVFLNWSFKGVPDWLVRLNEHINYTHCGTVGASVFIILITPPGFQSSLLELNHALWCSVLTWGWENFYLKIHGGGGAVVRYHWLRRHSVMIPIFS